MHAFSKNIAERSWINSYKIETVRLQNLEKNR